MYIGMKRRLHGFSDAVLVHCNECRQPDFNDVARWGLVLGVGVGMRAAVHVHCNEETAAWLQCRGACTLQWMPAARLQ
jgi:hypothetical protein